jgi:hypothetical protein
VGSIRLWSGWFTQGFRGIGVNQTLAPGNSWISCDYHFPQNLSPGLYHFRATIKNSVSALSDTFEVTAPKFACVNPPAWKPITSTSDPNYRSFRLVEPQAGDVVNISKPGGLGVTWEYTVDVSPLRNLDMLTYHSGLQKPR